MLLLLFYTVRLFQKYFSTYGAAGIVLSLWHEPYNQGYIYNTYAIFLLPEYYHYYNVLGLIYWEYFLTLTDF